MKEDQTEVWRPIELAPGYEVSDMGRVRSWRRWGGGPPGIGQKCRIRKLRTDRYGYPVAALRVDGRLRHIPVHRLVALAFIGPPPEGKPEVCHADGNPGNNRPDNLRWGSAADNAADKVSHGRSSQGMRNTQAKLTDSQVLEIRVLRGREKAVSIARRFGVSKSLIWMIWTNRAWVHLLPRVATES